MKTSVNVHARPARSAYGLRCGVSAIALGVLLSTSVHAQTAKKDDALDEIVVTGIKGSLQSAQGIKKKSDTIVDSVTAEDIGALPDRSVTESLQRIPGVAINRFAAGVDPDHFSVEGSGVVVRGLTYVRSEFNGREAFTANNGRALSFADVPSELLSGVDVFKSPSADRVEGGIAGVVNLRTRLPFEAKGFQLAGSIEANYGDFSKKTTPTGSILFSNRWDTNIGEIGVLTSFTYSQIKSRADRFQVSNFGPRTLYGNGNVSISVPEGLPVSPVVRQVTFPRGAVIGTQNFDKKRYGYSAALQWRSPDQSWEATFQFLRSDSREAWTEHTVEVATDNVANGKACDTPADGPGNLCASDSRAAPGTTLAFDDSGVFDNGVITSGTGWRDDQWSGNARVPRYGLQSNNIRRDVIQKYVTSDYSFNAKWKASDNLSVNFDYQHVRSDVDNTDVGLWTSSYQNAKLDLNGRNLPALSFLPPEVCSGPAANSTCAQLPGRSDAKPSYFGAGHTSFTDPFNSFYRASMDHIEDSYGNSDAARIDLDYTFHDNAWIDSVRAGYRLSDRDTTARFSTYNWGVLSEQWGNGGPVWLDRNVDGIKGGTGGTPAGNYESFAFDNFFRGAVSNPGADGRLFYSGNGAANYKDFVVLSDKIVNEWKGGGNNGGGSGWTSLYTRPRVIAGTPFTPGEITAVKERNNAAYLMVRYNHDFGSGWNLSGNIGVRYTSTGRKSAGTIEYPGSGTFLTEAQCNPPPVAGQPPRTTPVAPFCALSLAQRDNLRAFANGATIASVVEKSYNYVLPSFNAKLDVGNGLQFRAAYFKGVAPPQFGLTRNYYPIGFNGNQLLVKDGQPFFAVDGDAANAIPGLPFQAGVGNPLLLPTTSDNFDVTAEWYFSDVGSLTFSVFHKRLKNVLTNGTETLAFTNNGQTFNARVITPVNSKETGKITGFEIGYQQTFTFLPGLFSGLGISANYTYVDSKGVSQNTLSETDADVGSVRTSSVDTKFLPLQGLSKHGFNIAPFYEKGPISLRVAYNWRSDFLITVRDVIVPFQPIINEATGQMDASIFYTINDNFKIGVQGVNLLNETLKTSAVLAADEKSVTTAPRGFFVNDRRYSLIARFKF
jgi:TonB-dependent receptor